MAEPVNEGVTALPARALRPYVAWYCGYRQVVGGPGEHLGLPSPYLTMIVTLDDPLEMVAHPDPAQPGGLFDALVGGLHTKPALIRHDGRQSGVQLALTPWGARALLGPSAGELACLDAPLHAVAGRFADVLLDAVRGRTRWADRFAALDAALLARLARHREAPLPAAAVVRAWHVLQETGGRTDVATLAAGVGWSPRHLAHRFGLDVGLSPKQAARVVRFDRVRRRLLREAVSGAAPRLADLAVEHGYYDQPHLDREFRALAGAAPSRWLAHELRNVQVPHPEPAAD